MEKYQKQKKIGEGTYGVVYSVISKEEPKKWLAMKKIRMKNIKEGVSFTAIREIKILQDIHHENIISLLDIFAYKGNVYLIVEFMESDLETTIKDKNIILTPSDIKSYMLMILKGVKELHRNWILHRDLKPNNLLIGKEGILKIADFGFARYFGSPNPQYTNEVVTRWYRSPELLFGANQYGENVDMWSVGCIFAELMLRTPYFAGNSDIDQLSKIFAALGTPTEDQWPGMKSLPGYIPFAPHPPTPFKQLFTAATDDAIDLLSQFLKFDPYERLTASKALEHIYFKNKPSPTLSSKLPKSIGHNQKIQMPSSSPSNISLDTHKRPKDDNHEFGVSSIRRKINF